MFPWHGKANSLIMNPPVTRSSQQGGGGDGGGTSLFHVPQLRWLPKNTLTTPSETPSLRSRKADISHVVDSPTAPETPMSATPGDQSYEATSDGRSSPPDAAGSDTEQQGADISATSQGGARAGENGMARSSQALGVSLPPGAVLVQRPDDSYRNRPNHGKRLSIKEEIQLFEICNRYSATFGERSKLCEWWKMVAAEYTQALGHPYSWHSVRRKVEIVTKQRQKFLAEQKQNGREDTSDPEWRQILDAWVPVWERFEASEMKRIEIRDSRAQQSKKRKLNASSYGESADPATPTGSPWQQTPQRWEFPRPVAPSQATPNSAPPAPHSHPQMGPPPPPASATPQGVRMPAGYDTMFRPASGQGLPAPGPYPQPHFHSHHQPPPQQAPLADIHDAAAGVDSSVTSAVLETLSKLNKHLEQASKNKPGSTTSSPIVSALAAATASATDDQTEPTASSEDAPTTAKNADSLSSPDSYTLSNRLANLKAELRTEFKAELKKDREQLDEKLDSIQQTQEMILEMLRQEPGRE